MYGATLVTPFQRRPQTRSVFRGSNSDAAGDRASIRERATKRRDERSQQAHPVLDSDPDNVFVHVKRGPSHVRPFHEAALWRQINLVRISRARQNADASSAGRRRSRKQQAPSRGSERDHSDWSHVAEAGRFFQRLYRTCLLFLGLNVFLRAGLSTLKLQRSRSSMVMIAAALLNSSQ